jgi:hypothetical protein
MTLTVKIIGGIAFIIWLLIWVFIIIEGLNAPIIDEDEFYTKKED